MDDEQALDIEAVIADLEAKKSVIDSTIQALRGLYASGGVAMLLGAGASLAPGGQRTDTAAAMDPRKIPSTAFFGMRSIGDAAVKYLTLVKRQQTTKQIVDALDRGGFPHESSNIYSATYTALQRREKQGDVIRIGSEWAMASWFPGRGRKAKEEAGAKRAKKAREAVPRAARKKKLKALKAALDVKAVAAGGG